MSRRMQRATVVAAVGGLLLLSGCQSDGAGPGATPTQQLSSAVESLGETSELTTTVRLDATPADIASATAPGDKPVDPRMARLASAGTLVVQVKGDRKLSSYGPSSPGPASAGPEGSTRPATRWSAEVDGASVIELRSVGDQLYLRADARRILELAGRPEQYAELQEQASRLPAFVQAVAQNRWVSLPVDTARSLTGQLGAATPTTTPDPQSAQRLLDDLKAALTRDVTVTRAGRTEQGEHLVLTGSARKLAEDLAAASRSLVPVGSGRDRLNPQDVPDRQVSLDAYLADGQLREIRLDLMQFRGDASASAPAASGRLPLVVRFETQAVDIQKPAEATPVDLGQILPLLAAVGSPPTPAAVP